MADEQRKKADEEKANARRLAVSPAPIPAIPADQHVASQPTYQVSETPFSGTLTLYRTLTFLPGHA